PIPMTERERWLLDRIEELEKRVTELEARNSASSAAVPIEAAAHTAAPAPAVASFPRPAATNVEAASGASPTSPHANATLDKSSRQEQAASAKPVKADPFAFADFTWLNGNPRTKELAMDTKFFTPEVRADVSYIYDFNHPKDDTIGGSSEV